MMKKLLLITLLSSLLIAVATTTFVSCKKEMFAISTKTLKNQNRNLLVLVYFFE